MTLRPPQPANSPRPLDAEERTLARSLPRLHGRTAPGPDLDASILAAAQVAVRPANTPKLAARPRIRWIAPASLAASMVLAVGIAWQLRPLPTLESPQPTVQSDTADLAAVQAIEPAPHDEPAPAMHVVPAPAKSVVPARQQVNPPIVRSGESWPAPEAQAVEAMETLAPLPPPVALAVSVSPPAPPVPAPPAPAAPPARLGAITAEAPPHPGSLAKSATASSGNTLDTQVVDRAMRARMTAPTVPTQAASASSHHASTPEAPPASADKAGMIERTQQPARKAVVPSPVMPQARKEARMAVDAGFVDDPGEDVPPATVDSPAVRDAWLHRIIELLEQGKRLEAKASLAEFRRRYPGAVLPPRLRALEIES